MTRRKTDKAPPPAKGAQNKQIASQTQKQLRAHYAAKYPARKR